jgi:RHS repeat-associated protein
MKTHLALRHAGTGTTLPTSGTAALYYHRNQQYSILGLSDAAGTLVERYAYTAYGELTILAPDRTARATSSFQNRYTYTGREWDPTLRLYYFRARWLEPKVGRFIGRDPLGYVDGMGLYGAYLGLSNFDPSGGQILIPNESDRDSFIKLLQLLCPDSKLAVDFRGNVRFLDSKFCKPRFGKVWVEDPLCFPNHLFDLPWFPGNDWHDGKHWRSKTVALGTPAEVSSHRCSCSCLCKAIQMEETVQLVMDAKFASKHKGGAWYPWGTDPRGNQSTPSDWIFLDPFGRNDGLEGINDSFPPAEGRIRAPAWLVLGHELCGHFVPQLHHPPKTDPNYYTAMDPVIEIENCIRKEHSTQGNCWGFRDKTGGIRPKPTCATIE